MILPLRVFENIHTGHQLLATKVDNLPDTPWQAVPINVVGDARWKEIRANVAPIPEQDQPPNPQWTDKPTITGAYWEQVSDSKPSIVWIHEGKVYAATDPALVKWSPTSLKECLERGCRYYGPLPLPPTNPDYPDPT